MVSLLQRGDETDQRWRRQKRRFLSKCWQDLWGIPSNIYLKNERLRIWKRKWQRLVLDQITHLKPLLLSDSRVVTKQKMDRQSLLNVADVSFPVMRWNVSDSIWAAHITRAAVWVLLLYVIKNTFHTTLLSAVWHSGGISAAVLKAICRLAGSHAHQTATSVSVAESCWLRRQWPVCPLFCSNRPKLDFFFFSPPPPTGWICHETNICYQIVSKLGAGEIFPQMAMVLWAQGLRWMSARSAGASEDVAQKGSGDRWR